MIRDLIFEEDIYSGFDPDLHPADTQGWGGNNRIFRDLIAHVKPSLIVEVGSWQGQSAINMAKVVQDLNLGCEIVCVDTWLGAREMWHGRNKSGEMGQRYGRLRLKNGYPQIYYTFLSNVVRAGVSDIITPLPLPSTIAAKLLEVWKVKSDLTYIDASHDYPEVLLDCKCWYERTDKILFGHDVHQPRVLQAVTEFRQCIGDHDYRVQDDWWLVDLR